MNAAQVHDAVRDRIVRGLAIVGLAGIALVRGSNPRAWLAAGALASSVTAGYTLSRTTGLPGASGDVGNWGEQLGIASLFVEGAVSAFALRDWILQARLRAVAAEVAR
jgi:hypothetical protein